MAWWDNSWTKRTKITFDNSDQSEDLDSFPVLIVLTSQRVNYGYIQTDGDDIRFIDSNDSTELYYEVEEWDHGGTSHIWVRVPNIPQNSNTDYIYMYYGNKNVGATSYKNAAEVWNDGYFEMVQHLQETSPNTHEDSTGNNNDSISEAVTTQGSYAGKIDGADEFDGGDVGVRIGDSSSLDVTQEITIEAWVKDDLSSSKGRIVTKVSEMYVLRTNYSCLLYTSPSPRD